jgi:hypothetical protein
LFVAKTTKETVHFVVREETMKSALLTLAALVALPAPPAGDKEQLRAALGDGGLSGTWIYDDLEAAIAEAARTRKALMVVLRCVP